MTKERNDKIFEGMFLDATEGIIVSNKKGEIVLSNPSAQKMFAYLPSELLTLKIEDLIPKRYKDNHHHNRSEFYQNPEPRSMGIGRDLFASKKDGNEFPVEISLSYVKSGEEDLVVSFIIDISDRKKKDNELKKANEMLKNASFQLSKLNLELEQKVQNRTLELAEMIKKLMESKKEVDLALEKEKELNDMKSRFVSTASHEFRTPLATILSSVSLVGKYAELNETEKMKKHLDRIKESVSNLTDILNDFLSLDKLEAGVIQSHPEKVNINETILDLIETVKGIIKNGQNFVFENALKNNFVNLDTRIFRNLMINLMSNAIKYSNEGSQIFVRLKQHQNFIIIEVEDQGIGIPYEDQNNIFERFYRANNIGNIQGTGLGLNIAKKYVEIMGGNITFESVPDKGTTFILQIPN